MPKIIIVGGGYAGISAATALAECGFQVELLESRGTLGGRVYSTHPTASFPAPVDNGPHLFMGCYHETLKLFQRLEVPEPFHWIDPLRLSWLTSAGKKVSLHCAPLPAPFHLAVGLLFSNAFSFQEKISMALALRAFAKKPFKLPLAVETVANFLDATRQGITARERFWVPLCDSVMNVPVEVAPIRGLGEVLHRIFFGTRRDSALAVAKQPLSEVGFPRVLPYLRKRNSDVLFHEGVQAFKADSKFFEITTRSGKTHTSDALIWAVPPSSLAALWPKGTWPLIENLPRLGKSPILSVHIILSKPVIKEQLAGLSGAKFEWIFNRNANWGWKEEGQYLSFTASSAADMASLKDSELLNLALRELRERCPEAKDLSILHSKVTREMAATFVWSKETDHLRLPCVTPYPNVFLAGDWTDTGLPATIEGACLSGHKAAEKVRELLVQNP